MPKTDKSLALGCEIPDPLPHSVGTIVDSGALTAQRLSTHPSTGLPGPGHRGELEAYETGGQLFLPSPTGKENSENKDGPDYPTGAS